MSYNTSSQFQVSSSLSGDVGNSSHSEGNGTDVDHINIVHRLQVQVMFYMIYCIIFLVGVTGNCLVLYAVLHNRAMHTVTNYFILNLALSDILLCVLCVPFTPLYTFLQRWIFGEVLCHLVTCTQGICIYISSITLTIIAIDRFIVIIYPFRPRMQPSTSLLLILGTWVFSIGATLPYAVFVQHLKYDADTYVCMETFPEVARLTFGSITSVLQFVAPFFIMTVMYSLISLRLSSRTSVKSGWKSAKKEQADRERKRRTNRMLILMVAVFGLSWLPLNLMNLIDDISSSLDLEWSMWPYFHLLFFIAHAAAMSSTCYNPFLYAWLNENFRREFKEILPCFRRRQNAASGDRNKKSTANSLPPEGRELRALSAGTVTEEPDTRHTVIPTPLHAIDGDLDPVFAPSQEGLSVYTPLDAALLKPAAGHTPDRV